MKVWDLLPLSEEHILPFLGNIHLFYFFITHCITTFIPNPFPSRFVEKMTDLSVKEQKRLMLEAQAEKRGDGQSVAKLDLSDLITWILKKRNVTTSKIAPFISEPQVSTLPPPKDSRPDPPKKMKTLMSDEVRRNDWEISSLMQEDGGSNKTKSSNEFKLCGTNFDGLKFLYDHLNSTEDVNKVKIVGRQKLTQNTMS